MPDAATSTRLTATGPRRDAVSSMNVYIVSYDLNRAGQNYAGLYAELKKTTWWHYLDSSWLIATNETADQLWNRLSRHCDQNDRVLVIKVQSGITNRSGWLPKDAWDWIAQHVN